MQLVTEIYKLTKNFRKEEMCEMMHHKQRIYQTKVSAIIYQRSSNILLCLQQQKY